MSSLFLSFGGAIVGGIIGSFVPGIGVGLGSQIGFALGSLAGAILFAPSGPDVSGPRVDDLEAQSSQYGNPIPIVWGKFRLAGNIIWATDMVEVIEERTLGKEYGGGTITLYTYFSSFTTQLCVGPVQSISRIWANKKLIYDAAHPGVSRHLDSITIVLGTTTQDPSPVMEAIEGVGQVPAYRNRVQIVFDLLPLGDFGNQIPQIEAEINGDGCEALITRILLPSTKTRYYEISDASGYKSGDLDPFGIGPYWGHQIGGLDPTRKWIYYFLKWYENDGIEKFAAYLTRFDVRTRSFEVFGDLTNPFGTLGAVWPEIEKIENGVCSDDISMVLSQGVPGDYNNITDFFVSQYDGRIWMSSEVNNNSFRPVKLMVATPRNVSDARHGGFLGGVDSGKGDIGPKQFGGARAKKFSHYCVAGMHIVDACSDHGINESDTQIHWITSNRVNGGTFFFVFIDKEPLGGCLVQRGQMNLAKKIVENEGDPYQEDDSFIFFDYVKHNYIIDKNNYGWYIFPQFFDATFPPNVSRGEMRLYRIEEPDLRGEGSGPDIFDASPWPIGDVLFNSINVSGGQFDELCNMVYDASTDMLILAKKHGDRKTDGAFQFDARLGVRVLGINVADPFNPFIVWDFRTDISDGNFAGRGKYIANFVNGNFNGLMDPGFVWASGHPTEKPTFTNEGKEGGIFRIDALTGEVSTIYTNNIIRSPNAVPNPSTSINEEPPSSFWNDHFDPTDHNYFSYEDASTVYLPELCVYYRLKNSQDVGNFFAQIPPGILDVSTVGIWGIYEFIVPGIFPGKVTLQRIVDEISELVDIPVQCKDTNDLATQFVRGYAASRVAPARSFIDTLRRSFFFDAAETAGTLKFIFRGKAAIASLVGKDLGAAEGSMSKDILIIDERVQEVDLPEVVVINYIDIDRDYQSNSATARRNQVSTPTVNELVVESPIVFTPTEAELVVQQTMWITWISRIGYRWTTLLKHLDLDPSDVINITVDGIQHQIMITDVGLGANNVLNFQGISDDIEIHVNDDNLVVADASGFLGQTVFIPGPVTLEIMDVATFLDEENNFFLVHVASTAVDYIGATVFISDDDITYKLAGHLITEATIGEVINSVKDYECFGMWDESAHIDVRIPEGKALNSATKLDVYSINNIALVGFEIIGYRNAFLLDANTYRLTGLLRGLQGTDWAAPFHSVGDRFVALRLDGSTVPIPLTQVDLNQIVFFKAIKSGDSLEDVETTEVVYRGNNLAPISPSHIRGTWDGSENLTITWVRRARIDAAWSDNTDVPLDEETENYEVDVWSSISEGGPVTIVNPGFETGTHSGWGGFDTDVVSAAPFGTDPGPRSGTWFLAHDGNLFDTSYSISQTIDLTTFFSILALDGGNMTVSGTFAQAQVETGGDTGRMSLTFRDSGGGFLSQETSEARTTTTGVAVWEDRTMDSKPVPVGARDFFLSMSAVRVAFPGPIKTVFDDISVTFASPSPAVTFERTITNVASANGSVVTPSTQSAYYDNADQTADGFPAGSDVEVEVFQMSSLVGRGHGNRRLLSRAAFLSIPGISSTVPGALMSFSTFAPIVAFTNTTLPSNLNLTFGATVDRLNSTLGTVVVANESKADEVRVRSIAGTIIT